MMTMATMMNVSPRRVATAIAALVAAVVAGGASAAPQRLSAQATVNAATAACLASAASITRTPPLRLDFTCATSAARFRCELTGTASYTVATNRVAGTCFAITEVPRSNPADLVFAAGAEG